MGFPGSSPFRHFQSAPMDVQNHPPRVARFEHLFPGNFSPQKPFPLLGF